MTRTKWHQKLAVRLVILGTLAVTFSVLWTVAVLVALAEEDTLKQRQALEVLEAERTAALLNEKTRQLIGMLEIVAGQLPMQSLNQFQEVQSLLAQRPLLIAAFDTVFFASKDGRMRVVHDDRGFRTTEISLQDRSYFTEVLYSGRPAISEPVMGRLSGEPVVVIAVPVVHESRVVGVLGGGIRVRTHPLLNGLQGRGSVADYQRDNTAQLVMVTDSQANIVWHPDAQKVGRGIDQEPVVAALMADWTRSGGPINAIGTAVSLPEQLGAYAGMTTANWIVWRIQSKASVLEPINQARWIALRAGAFVTLTLTVGLAILLWWLLAPLRLLQLRASKMFDTQLSIEEGWPKPVGEIGELGSLIQRVLREKAAIDLQADIKAAQLQSVLGAAPIAILLTRNRCFELVSPAACRILRRTENELVGQLARVIYFSNWEYEKLGPLVGEAFSNQREFEGELEFIRGDSTTFWGRLIGRPVSWSDSSAGTIWTVFDISDEKREREALEWKANHDALTGLANRAALIRQLERHIVDRGMQRPSALLLMDLDRFKPVNDQHGHAAGDAVLKGVALALVSCVRGGDLVARLGGDEFAVLLRDCTTEVALRVASSICETIKNQKIPWGGLNLEVGISVGVAPLLEEVTEFADWMACADQACYTAKELERGTVALYKSTAG
ncbi:sensor domain-containing diguanylate cyclase [Rhodoferax mekongensis]|uniref:Diguanylate cyclase n=1 Tax=Rhodoferax mekongensis TaxID=3068341 RepID=A0ABZ0B2R7_9BURK|nr:diguanylate cyclase [Rhodoferax sp. TBRC 17307]WNO06143.1 diguanylate cyclase [Rhodoferax sp. TBRC 17307]